MAKYGKNIQVMAIVLVKKETYYGMKVHTVTDLNGNPIDYLLTKVNVNDRDTLYELSDKINILVN